MLSVSSPLARRASDDGPERSAESRLIGEPRLKRHFRQRTGGVDEEGFGPFDALQDEVAVWRGSKGLTERFREMAHGQATFTRQGREAERPVEMFGEQLSRAALLPRRETATVLASGAERRGVGVGDVRTEQQTEIVKKEQRRTIAPSRRRAASSASSDATPGRHGHECTGAFGSGSRRRHP